jgi:hypothetical protein
LSANFEKNLDPSPFSIANVFYGRPLSADIVKSMVNVNDVNISTGKHAYLIEGVAQPTTAFYSKPS